eukprot:20409_1
MRRYLKQTINLIGKRKYDEYVSYKLCATIRKSETNELISCGYNRSFSGHYCEIFNKMNVFDYNCNAIHAEQDAICKAREKRLKYQLCGSTIYIARVKPNGLIGNAKPCEYCLQFIIKHNVSKICYTLNDDQYIVLNLDQYFENEIIEQWTGYNKIYGQIKQL